GADELESRREVTAGLQGGEAGKQVPPHQVARAAEHDEPVDHVKALAGRGGGCRASWAALTRGTPAATTAMWLNACGDFPENSPEAGSICSGSSPRVLARAHRDPYSSEASSSRPWCARFSTSQKLHSTNAPSSPGSPSGECSCR